MIRRSLLQVRLYSQKVDPTQAFDFIPAKMCDLPDLVDMCTTSFIQAEPHSKALSITAEGTRGVFENIVAKALHYPYSYRIHEKGTNKMIGFRLISVGHRDNALDIEPVPLVRPTEQGTLRFAQILDESKKTFWELVDPYVEKVIRREITFVVPQHQRKGIANYLIHLGLDFQELRNQGFHGLVSEATSLANQRLLTKHGYTCISRPNYKLDMFDGNDGVMVFFKDLRK
ncbi:hypothetical protein ANCCAN_03789 [Ancylostoma caninum]|uniref:N-acetyltransferase domain-containing protein n=1 Tax=Ancylostoma caninum TaxID=29170 RepID=A0A368H0S4_ANCCA|nr:hypothetical protein ANCCAN_03789 [Ancylostoma caninum]